VAILSDLPTILGAIHAGQRAAGLESRVLEFKREKATPEETERDIAEAVICLANGIGGTVVVGVSDRAAGPAALMGTALDPDRLRKTIHATTQPNLLVEVEAQTHFGVRLLVVLVPEGIEVYADRKGRAYRRINDDCQPMSPAEVARLREDRLGVDWSAKRSDRRPDEVSPLAMATLRATLAGLPDERREHAQRSDLDLLRLLGLLADGMLNHAGELLLTAAATGNPRIAYQFRPTPGGEPTASERIETPLVIAFPRVMEVVRARLNSTPLTLPDGQQIQLQDFPELAVRESIANGIVHRDHQLRGPVVVEHSPAVLSVTSPGPLVSGVTPENILTHPPKPRNRALANAARILGFAEEYGPGVDRMYVAMIRAGRGVPIIEASAHQVAVRLVGGAPNTHIARYVAQLPSVERDDTDALLILFHLCSHRTVTAPEIAPVLQRGPAEAETILRRLAVDPPAMVEPTRGRRTGSQGYKLGGSALAALGPAVTYQQRTAAETDRKMIAHVREYGKVTNRTVQNLFDLTVHPANNLLDDLIRRGILVKTSPQQRGPAVEYGPGPRFPKPPKGTRGRRVAEDPMTLWHPEEGR